MHFSPGYCRQLTFIDYSYNAYLLNRWRGDLNGYMNNNAAHCIASTALLKTPSNSIAIADSWKRNEQLGTRTNLLYGTNIGNNNAASYGTYGAHGKMMNGLYLDGHVESTRGIYVDKNNYCSPWWEGANPTLSAVEY